jgi:drug/metabolite transporter (DMT)-like permease
MWLYFALLSALLSGFANIARRTHGSLAQPAELSWWLYLFGLPLGFGMLLISNQPHFTSYAFILPMVAVSILYTAAGIFQFRAYKFADASLVSPIANFLPLFLILTSFIGLGVLPGWGGLVGIILVVFGVYYTSVSGKHALSHPLKQLLRNRGSRAMMLTVVTWSIADVLEKIALNSASPAFLILCQSAISFGLLSGYLLLQPQRKRLKRGEKVMKRWGWHIAAISVFAFLSTFFQLQSMDNVSNPSYVLAVKRIDVLVTVLFAGLFLREKHILKRFEGSLVAIAGVALIVIFK